MKVLTDQQKGFRITAENMEFSLKAYSDEQLRLTNNRQDLVSEQPFLRVNKKQVGVGGDDSWGLWSKKEYYVQDKEFHLTISKI